MHGRQANSAFLCRLHVVLRSLFQLTPGIVLSLTLSSTRLFCACTTHARLFAVAVDEGFRLQGLGLSGETGRLATTHTCLCPQHWDYMCTTALNFFYVGSWD